MRLGIVGAGVIAARYAERIAGVDGPQLGAVTDVAPERTRALAEQHGATAHASLDGLFADVDTVINLTIPAAHADVTRAALAAGKHVHTEKPVALHAEDAHALAAFARERGV